MEAQLSKFNRSAMESHQAKSFYHFIVAYQISKIKLGHFKTSIDHIQKKEPDGKSNPSGPLFLMFFQIQLR